MGVLAVSNFTNSFRNTLKNLGASASPTVSTSVPLASGMTSINPGSGIIRFFSDGSYMPQSETSVSVDPSNTANVVGGVNDARFFFCPFLPASNCPSGFSISLSGFSVSKDGGTSLLKSGDLPGLLELAPPGPSTFLVSFGDPTVAAGTGGNFFFSSLAIAGNGGNAIELSLSNSNLFGTSTCVTPSSAPWTNPCWSSTLVFGNLLPNARSFEDKPLIAVDHSSSAFAGDVYVAWDHFFKDGTSASFMARCDSSLSCVMLAGGPLPPLSGSDLFPAFTTPVVGSDGSVFVTWCNYGTTTALTPITCKERSSGPGGTSFGTTNTVTSTSAGLVGYATEQYRVINIPTIAVDSSGNIYFAIDVCKSGNYFAFFEPNSPGNCGFSDVLFAKSSTGGSSWTFTTFSPGAVTSQPWLTVNPSTGAVYLVYYTTQFDSFNHRIDVAVQKSTNAGGSFTLTRITSVSIEPDSDPTYFFYPSTFGGSWVAPQFGDYFQAVAQGTKLYILFSGTYTAELGTFQTDPYLAVASL